MDMQKMMDVMSASWRRERSKYHLTLGGAIAALEKLPELTPLKYDQGGAPSRPHSYRGYYSDLCFEVGAETTVGHFLKMCRECLDKEFTGYKGGEFRMGADTPLWLGSYGTSGGLAIVGLSHAGDTAILMTKAVED